MVSYLVIPQTKFGELHDNHEIGTSVILAIDESERDLVVEYEVQKDNPDQSLCKGDILEGYHSKIDTIMVSELEETPEELLERFKKEEQDDSKTYGVYTLGQLNCDASIIE